MGYTGREIVPGAPPAAGGVGLAVPEIGDAERALVQESLDSGWVAYGPFVDRFEAEVRRLLGVEHAVAVASGTAALHLALVVAGVEPDDEVAVSTLTFISPAFAIRYADAWPIFVDAERTYRQLDVERLEAFLRDECDYAGGVLRRRSTRRRVAAVVAVDVLGHPADLDAVREVAAHYELPVIEDAAEGLGATSRDRPLGGLGDVGCLSFNGNKIVTAGSGGMVVTNDAATAERVRYLATQAKDDPLEYVHGEVGFNYRLSNVHAALGYGQLLRLDEFVAAKRRIAAAYADGLGDLPGIELPREAPDAFCTFWLYTVHVHPEEFGLDSRGLLRRLAEAGIQSRPLWQPLHRSPSLADAPRMDCPVADELCATGLSLPCSTGLTKADQARVIAAVAAAARS
jgi:perosamine synthetase